MLIKRIPENVGLIKRMPEIVALIKRIPGNVALIKNQTLILTTYRVDKFITAGCDRPYMWKRARQFSSFAMTLQNCGVSKHALPELSSSISV